MTCAPPDTGQLVAERLADYLNCQAQSLGTNGFANLSGGWLGPALLAGCLTIYVALVGYRLILGSPFGPREAVLTAVRAGIVLAFATSWSAYETVIYRLVNDGPAEVASQLLPADLSVPSLPEAARRLDEDYASLQAGGANSLPPPAPPSLNASASVNLPPAGIPASPTSQPDPTLDHAGFLLVVIVVGSLGALKLASGLLLGSGPLFLTLGLFDVTLGVVQGWARGLLSVFIGATGGISLTALALSFVEAQLPQASQSVAQGNALGEPTLMATSVFFAIAMLIVLVVAFAVGCSFRIPAPLIRSTSQFVRIDGMRRASSSPTIVEPVLLRSSDRSQAVVDAVHRIGLRERTIAAASPSARSFAPVHTVGHGSERSTVPGSTRIGRDDPELRRNPARAHTPSVQQREHR